MIYFRFEMAEICHIEHFDRYFTLFLYHVIIFTPFFIRFTGMITSPYTATALCRVELLALHKTDYDVFIQEIKSSERRYLPVCVSVCICASVRVCVFTRVCMSMCVIYVW